MGKKCFKVLFHGSKWLSKIGDVPSPKYEMNQFRAAFCRLHISNFVGCDLFGLGKKWNQGRTARKTASVVRGPK